MISSQKVKNIRVQAKEDKISLTLKVSQNIDTVVLKFEDNNTIPLKVSNSEGVNIKIDNLYKIEVPTDDFEYYEGIYEVTPMITSQILYTKEKMMRDNVLIETIPTEETLNAAGGYTFIIGG